MEAPTPQSMFTKFPELPIELRLQIWGLASQVTRALELEYCRADRQFFVSQHVPSVLHTNSESREVGLSHYHLSFGTEKHPPATYFNPIYDIVYFGTRQNLMDISFMVKHFYKVAKDLQPRDQIQRLGITETLWASCSNDSSPVFSIMLPRDQPPRSSISTFLSAFPQLRQLIFVCRPQEEPDWESEIEDKWEDYSGVSLIESEDNHEDLLTDERFDLRKFHTHLSERNLATPEDPGPSLKFMEYGFA
ncbi:uncharacterized protein LY89DRAFT_682078 [Mollisia scopiformis]|uniref:2EXR domain-containing protein n=1 Tax=Mollisia scopiformis TaxID=149040 RepID=A0A194XJ95_MOLSC|nr:uncharacterized protein LY89DRAFT_682078 [Mollisia scopiformis]KUJ20320.1 hypothetical protein LY89DRAFT_682078 [Mollisia scopiformis]